MLLPQQCRYPPGRRLVHGLPLRAARRHRSLLLATLMPPSAFGLVARDSRSRRRALLPAQPPRLRHLCLAPRRPTPRLRLPANIDLLLLGEVLELPQQPRVLSLSLGAAAGRGGLVCLRSFHPLAQLV